MIELIIKTKSRELILVRAHVIEHNYDLANRACSAAKRIAGHVAMTCWYREYTEYAQPSMLKRVTANDFIATIEI